MKTESNGTPAGRLGCQAAGLPGGKGRPGSMALSSGKMLAGLLVLCAILMGSMGCGEGEQNAPASLPTRGGLVLGIDESLRPFAEAEIEIFSVYYPDARVAPLYLPEKQVLEKLLENEIQTAIICRDLYPEESGYLADAYGHSARAFKLADDAIVAVVNEANHISTLSPGDLRGILSGAVSDWGQLPAAMKSGSPILVILTGSSSVDRYFSAAGPLSPTSVYALGTTTEVVDYVRKDDKALGVVVGSWFYRKGNINNGVRVLAYSTDATGKSAGKAIPSREVYAVTHEPNTGLGSGFISFMASQKGQLILSKAGMTPCKPIEREIKLSDTF